MVELINILCATDNNYAAICGVMLTSLFENNVEKSFSVFVLGDNLSHENIELLNNLAKKYNQIINIIEPPKKLFDNFPVRKGDHISLASYFRIACEFLLPEHIKRIIYLDCDLIVNTNINKLWKFPLENSYLGAVIDSASGKQVERLKLNPDSEYYNAGILLIDINKFREEKIYDKCVKEINANPDKFKFHDQDLLNVVLEGKIKKLPLIYNIQSAFIRKDLSHNPNYEFVPNEVKKEVVNYLKKPYSFIIHYDGPIKPWSRGVLLKPAFSNIWTKYYKITGLKIRTTNKSSLQKTIKNCLFNFFWITGIKAKPDFYKT